MDNALRFSFPFQIVLFRFKIILPLTVVYLSFSDNLESSSFAKLFIGSVPRTATEEDVSCRLLQKFDARILNCSTLSSCFSPITVYMMSFCA